VAQFMNGLIGDYVVKGPWPGAQFQDALRLPGFGGSGNRLEELGPAWACHMG
jgi:hypothetical protein